MKLSELIARLEDLRHICGDVKVTCYAGDSYFPSTNAYFDEGEQEVIIECDDLNY